MSAQPVEAKRTYRFGAVTCTVGEVMSRQQLDALPLESVVIAPNGDKFTKVTMDSNANFNAPWQREDGHRQNIANDYNSLYSVPSVAPDHPESAAAYRRRFADFVMTKVADLSEQRQEEARTVLTELGLLGGDLSVGDSVTSSFTAPHETVVQFAGPDHPRFTVFRYDSHQDGWVKVSGHYDSMADVERQEGSPCQVVYVPGDPFVYEVGDQAQMRAEFESFIWAKAIELKPQYKWCSALEKVLEEFGMVNPTVLPDFRQFRTIIEDRDARAELLNGAVLGASSGDWGIFVKVGEDDKTGRGWEQKAGNRPKARGPMHLLGDGRNPTRLIARINRFKDFLPAGCTVQVRYTHRKFVKQPDGTWLPIDVRDAVPVTSNEMRATLDLVAW